MKILPEKVFVLADAEKSELMVVMEGFRMTLTGDEAHVLRDGLTQGLTKLIQQSGSRSTPLVALSPTGVPEAKRTGSN